MVPYSAVTTVLIYANADLEADLHATLFWREDLERYLAERVDEARMLLFSTEPHVLVVDRTLAGADELIGALESQSLPHPISLVALSHGPADQDEIVDRVNAHDSQVANRHLLIAVVPGHADAALGTTTTAVGRMRAG